MSWVKLNHDTMPHIGEIVRLPMHRARIQGIVIDNTCETGWCDVLLEDGEVVKWPPIQLEIMLSDELTDKQLEKVQGGMSQERFSLWRAVTLNEDG